MPRDRYIGTAVGLSVMAAALLVAACGGAAPTPAPTVEPAAFDLAHVKATWTAECADPFNVDDLFCEQVQVAGMTAEGTILNVPTGLNAASRDRADVLCQQIASAHFDEAGVDLGYEVIGILDKDGGNLAACSVS